MGKKKMNVGVPPPTNQQELDVCQIKKKIYIHIYIYRYMLKIYLFDINAHMKVLIFTFIEHMASAGNY